MPTEIVNIQINEKGAREVKRNINDIARTSRKTSDSLDFLRRSLISLGGALVLRNSINTLRTFGQEMSTVKAVSGATEAQFKSLREEAQRLGTNTRFTATQAAEGMTFLARAGFDASETLATIEDTLLLAQAGALDLGSAADIATNVLTGFRLKTSQTSRVVDVLAKAANSSNTNVLQLGEGMKFAAPVAAGLGVQVEETAAAIGTLSNAGLQATLAGTGLRTAMLLLESPTSTGEKTLKKYGLTQDDVSVKTHGLINVLETLAATAFDVTDAVEIAGLRGGPALDILVQSARRGDGEFRKFAETFQDIDGYAKEVADTMDDNLNGAILATLSAAEGIVLIFGELGANDALISFFKSLTSVLRATANNLDVVIDGLTILGTILAAKKFAPYIAGLARASAAQLKFTANVVFGNEVLSNSAKAEAGRAETSAKIATQNLAKAKSEQAVIATQIESLRFAKAQLVADREQLLINHQRIINSRGRTKNLTKIAEVRRAELALTRQITEAELAHTAASNSVSVAAAREAQAINALSVAKSRATITGRALTVATRGLKTALAFLGGPVGAVLIAVTAFFTLRDAFDKTKKGAEILGNEIDVVGKKLEELSISQLEVKLINTDEEIEALKDFQSELKDRIGTLPDQIKRVELAVLRSGGAEAIRQNLVNLQRELNISEKKLIETENAINIRLERRQQILGFIDGTTQKLNKDLDKLFSSRKDLFGTSEEPEIKLPSGDILGEAEQLAATLREQIALSSEATNLEKVKYALENTELQKLLPVQKQKLENLARELDIVEKQRKTEESLKKVRNDLTAQNQALKLEQQDRESFLQILNLERDLEVQLTQAQREEIIELQKTNEELKTRADILDSVKGPQLSFIENLRAINEELKNEKLSLSQSNELIIQQTQSIYQSGIDSTNNFIEAYRAALDKLEEFRREDIKNEETYQKGKAELEKLYNQTKLEYASDFFGNIATLSSSENKKLAAIGKAAAITQATIQGIVAVQNALAVQPYPLGVALAAAAGVAAAANVAKIASTPNRALGGIVEEGQQFIGGESSFNRPEFFQGQSGKQFIIPPERGNVVPFKETFNRKPSQNAPPNVNVTTSPPQVIVVDSMDKAKEYLNSSEYDQLFVKKLERNKSAVSNAARNG